MKRLDIRIHKRREVINTLFEKEKDNLIKANMLGENRNSNNSQYRDIYVLQLGSLKELYNLIHIMKEEANEDKIKQHLKSITIEIDRIFKLQTQITSNPIHIRFLTGEIADLIFKLPLQDIAGLIKIFQDIVINNMDRSYYETMYYTHLLGHLSLMPKTNPENQDFITVGNFPVNLKNKILLLNHQLQKQQKGESINRLSAVQNMDYHYNKMLLRDYLILFTNYIKSFSADDPQRNQIRYILGLINSFDQKYRVGFHILEQAIMVGNLFGFQEPLAMTFIYSYLEKPLYRRFYDEVHARDKRFIYESTQNYLDYLYHYPVNTNLSAELNWFARYFGLEPYRKTLAAKMANNQPIDDRKVRKRFARQKTFYLYKLRDFFSEIYGTPFMYTEEKNNISY